MILGGAVENHHGEVRSSLEIFLGGLRAVQRHYVGVCEAKFRSGLAKKTRATLVN